jgi:rhamnulokinase
VLPPIVESGTDLGSLLPGLADDLGAARVIAPATHDTGSAIAAIPAEASRDWGYVSSGTWSLVGVEIARPLLSEAARDGNFTNEGGVFGTTRLLKNVMGMWLLNECQRRWVRDGHARTHTQVDAEVAGAEPFAALIDPDDVRFLAPEDMPAAINGYLREHGQQPLTTHAAFARCIMESLVLRYVEVFQQASRLTGMPIRRVHVVGGGSRNARMNQWLSDAMDAPVYAGPAEATALGNALMQLVGLGELSSLEDVRRVARAAPTTELMPRVEATQRWREAADRFAALTA